MLYSVTDVARILGLTSSAIRYLEKEKLIQVEKDESGHRYYTVVDVFRFLSYTKYRSMEFPMKTIVKQFSGVEDDRLLIYERLEDRMQAARRKAEHYTMVADAIAEHLASAHEIERLLDNYEFAKCPPQLILYDDECGWISKNRKAQQIAQKWVKAMPVTRLVVLSKFHENAQAVFGYSIAPDKAEPLGLPTDLHVQQIPSVSCLHTIAATTEAFTEDPSIIFEKPLAYAKQHGLQIAGAPWAHILLVEVAPELKLKPYVEIWVPITLQ